MVVYITMILCHRPWEILAFFAQNQNKMKKKEPRRAKKPWILLASLPELLRTSCTLGSWGQPMDCVCVCLDWSGAREIERHMSSPYPSDLSWLSTGTDWLTWNPSSLSVGKSSMTIQFVENVFVDSYYPTIENTFTKPISHQGQEYAAEIIDTAGQVRCLSRDRHRDRHRDHFV